MDEADKICGMHGGLEKWITGLEGIVKEEEHMEDLSADGVVIKMDL